MVEPPEPDAVMLHPEPPAERARSGMGHAGFRYDDAPGLFLGRSGEGPLRLVFDTNIVIPLTQRFEDVVGGLGLVGLKPLLWDEPDVALQDLFAVWFWRHLTVHISELVLDDAKKKLPTDEQMRARLNALETFARDRWLRGDDSRVGGPGALPDLADLPPRRDGELVRDAVAVGAHVFVTFDRGILRYDDALRRWGLRLMEPKVLLRDLEAAGEFSRLTVGGLPPVADLLMLSELYALLPEDDG